MEDILYKSALKNKKTELINSISTLGEHIGKKIREKNLVIKKLSKELEENNSTKIKEKNEELDKLKKELNLILQDIDTVINNITK